MYFKISCPQCSKALKVPDEMAGKKCQCPYCKTSLMIPMPSSLDLGLNTQGTDSQGAFPNIDVGATTRTKPKTTPASTQQAPASTAVQWSDGSDVSLVLSGAIGFGCAVLLFAVLFPLKAADVRIGAMFWDSIGINFPTTWLMFWSFAILGLKSRQLARQKSAMLMDLLPSEISKEITLDSLDNFIAHIHSLPAVARESMLVNRVVRGIEHFRVRKSAAETVTMMESQSEIDASNVAGSYTIVKVFIWAMPILGFIGTVMGVSNAVAGLSGTLENAADVSAVTASMKNVFGGLGTAFDTTLLALVMSLVVKIPTSAMQKSEDGLVTIVDEYCNENLLRRLNDWREGGAERGTGGMDNEVFREAVEAALGTHHAELENWLGKLDAIGTRLTSQVAEGWANISDKMQLLQRQQLANFERQYTKQVNQLQSQIEEITTSTVNIQQTLGNMTEQAATTQREVSETVSASTEALRTHFAGLEQGLNGLSKVLESLGEQQVVVQQVERRGWFGRKRNGR